MLFKKSLSALLAFVLLTLCCIPAAMAESWSCTKCSKVGNTGNFCSNCASPKPFLLSNVCPSCNASNNAGDRYCQNCAKELPSENGDDPAAIYLVDLDRYDHGGYVYDSNHDWQLQGSYLDDLDRDILGNTYSGIICPRFMDYGTDDPKERGFVEYFLNGKYTTFRGTLYLPYKARGIEDPSTPSLFKVYVDNTLIYTAPDFRKGSIDPVPFSLNISGCRVLRIEILGCAPYHSAPMICAGDLTLQ